MKARSLVSAVAGATATMLLCIVAARAQEVRKSATRLMPSTLGALRAEDARVERMLRAGGLRMRESLPDKLVPGRRIDRSDQYHQGVRVFGADVSRQLARGQIVSIYGVVYDDITVDPNPRVDESEARRLVEERTGARLGPHRGGELVILPRDDGSYALTWRIRAATGNDLREYFVDAHSGVVAFEFSDLQTQSAIGRATGTLGDSKKMSALFFSGAYMSEDARRPPAIRTYDMRGNPQRTVSIINGFIPLAQPDLGTDADNVWTDGALTDGHIYTGYTYDYYFARFNRRGLDDANIRMASLVHPVRREDFAIYGAIYSAFFANAAYYGNGLIAYGVGLPPGATSSGRTWNHTTAALDIVAHELTHGVTDYSSDLIYRNESGALNESFSDVMGTAVEFMFHPPGSGVHQADYQCGEDAVRPAGIRSFSDPSAFGHPDHYSIRFTGTSDNGGVHINSSISNHAYYLAIEGGTNQVSGLAVQGVGRANRVQIESVYYRAFTQLLPANASFAMARQATIQAARDLYGADSAAERAIMQAWTAVGVE